MTIPFSNFLNNFVISFTAKLPPFASLQILLLFHHPLYLTLLSLAESALCLKTTSKRHRNILVITVKTCDLDPLPTSLLAGCLEDLPHFISTINNSLSHSSFPNCHHETTLESQLLILKFERTTDLSPISPFFLKYWKESFSFNALIIFRQIICSSLISHLIGLVIALKQHSSKLIMTTSLLKTTINFCSCLFQICLPLFTPLIIPLFCHISTLTLSFRLCSFMVPLLSL